MTRATVRRRARLAGVDRTGRPATVEVAPAPAGAGIRFNGGRPASPGAASAWRHATGIGRGRRRVAMVEHLLAACHGLGVTDLDVVSDGAELPLGDGSALPYVRLLGRAGVVRSAEPVEPLRPGVPVLVSEGRRFIAAVPAPRLQLSCLARLPGPVVQHCLVRPHRGFARELAPARTFGVTRAACGPTQRALRLPFRLERRGRLVLPTRPRFADETCRHKALDLFGDLWLLGRPLQAEVFAFCPGHGLNIRFARRLQRILEER